jgi:hypothetical protein
MSLVNLVVSEPAPKTAASGMSVRAPAVAALIRLV